MSVRQWIRTAAALVILAAVAGLLLVDPVVRAIHAGMAPEVIVGLLQGRDFLPPEHYIRLARDIVSTPLVGLLIIGVVTAIATSPDIGRRASRVAHLLDTRSGLVVLVGVVATASLVLALIVEQPAFRAGIPTSSLSPGSVEIALSHGTGFYADEIEVVVATDRPVELHFTLDGSQPDPVTNARATQVVSGPIRIVDRSDEPNVYADIPTTAQEFWRFVPPSGPVPKATVLRVRGEGTEEVFATYFVGDRVAPVTLPTMSLIAEPAYLFDPHIGIRVPGALTDAWRVSDRSVLSPNFRQVEANYQMRGRAWERPLRETLDNPVLIQFCEADGSCVFDQSVGIRTHGGFSRSAPNKSWRLYARDDYGEDRIAFQFFAPETPLHSRLLLRHSGNDWDGLRFMDAFWHSVLPDDHVDTQAYRPTRLFVNGEYWGIHNIRERQDDHYVENVHGVPREHVEMLDNSTGVALQRMRNDPPPEGAPRASPEDPGLWEDWVRLIRRIDRDAPDVAMLSRDVDIASFSDFVIAHAFAGVSDWVSNNTRWWRASAAVRAADDPARDGRWRFMIADFDSAMRQVDPFLAGPGSKRIVHDPSGDPERADGLPALFGALTGSVEGRTYFLNRSADLMNTALDPARTTQELDAIVELLEPEMDLSRRRWSTGDMDAWHRDVAKLREFLESRPDAMRNELVEFFDLDGTMVLGLDMDPRLTSVQLNSIDLLDGSAAAMLGLRPDGRLRWSGEYFVGVPVTLSAHAADGLLLTGWAGLPADATVEADGSVTFVPRGDVTLRALVEPTH